MQVSSSNHEAQVAIYHSAKRIVQPLGVWLGCVGEEFLIQHFPDKDPNWRGHQLEYMNWGPYISKDGIDFCWMNGGSEPLFPAYPETDLTADDLLRLYEETRSLWISLHVESVSSAAQLLSKDDLPVETAILPDALRWMVLFLAEQEGQPTKPLRLFGYNVKFPPDGPYQVVTPVRYGPKTQPIEFPPLTKMTLDLMPDVRIRKDSSP